MDKDDLFWIAVLRLVAAVFMGLVVAIASCTSFNAQKVSEIQARGVDPIGAHCAIHGGGQNRTICDAYVAKGKQ